MNPRALRSAAAAAGALALIVVPFALTDYGLHVLSLWAFATIAAIGLNLTFGHAGQVSLGQGAFVGIGAYTAALLTTHGWPFAAAYVLAFVICFGLGWSLGYPALRVRRPYLPFLTLAFGAFVFLVFRNEEWLTGGIYGINRVPRPSLFGLSTRGRSVFVIFACSISPSSRRRSGGCCAPHGDARWRRCARTRCAPKPWASIPASTR